MSELTELARSVVARARPGEQVEVYAARGRSTTVRAHEGRVESLKSGSSAGVGVRVVFDSRQGFASAGAADLEIALAMLDEARENASLAEPDPFVGLVSPDGVSLPAFGLLDPSLTLLTDQQRIDMAIEVERLARSLDSRIEGVRVAAFSDAWGEAAVVSTEGIDVWSDGGSCSVAVSPLARDGSETQIGSGVDAARAPGLLDIGRAARDGVERAVSMLGASKPASGRMAAVFDPRVTASLMGIVAGTLSGDRVNRGRSPFADRLGDLVASQALTLVDDPTDPSSLAADLHDGEGLATRPNVLIDSGRLDRFLYHSESARRAGTSSTASAVRSSRSTPSVGYQALRMEPGSSSTQQLLADAGEAILIEAINGIHSGVNAISGDISVGIQGHMIRDGMICEPVREATMATTIQRLLFDIVQVGAEVEMLPGGTVTAPLLVESVSISGR